jgi:hypothetical protein
MRELEGAGARAFLFSLVLLLCAAASGIAQQTVRGKVVDPQQNPVAGIEVMMHAVTENIGGDVDTDTTDANGVFDLTVAVVDPTAVYFVAVVHQSQLYMGDLMRAPLPIDKEYIVRVGVDPVEIASPPTAPVLTPEEQQRDRTAGIAVILAGLAVIAALASIGLSRRAPAHRRWLVELARLEDDLAANPSPDAALQKRRNELRARLKAPRSG